MDQFLKNKRVLLTGFPDTNKKAATFVEQFGGEPLSCPLQEMNIIPGSVRLLGRSDWVLFTSPASARLFMQHLFPLNPFEKAACVGPGTREALEDDYGVPCKLLPERDFSSLGLAQAIIDQKSLFEGKRILFPCSELAGDVLEKHLADEGLQIKRHNFYRPEAKHLDSLPDFDAICFFSSSAVQSLGELQETSFLEGKKIAVIGDSTAETFEETFGLPYVKASSSNAEQTVRALAL